MSVAHVNTHTNEAPDEATAPLEGNIQKGASKLELGSEGEGELPDFGSEDEETGDEVEVP